MAPCERCGTGTRSGRGKGWCSNLDCREAEKKEKQEEKEAAKRLRQEERKKRGAAGEHGPCPDRRKREEKRLKKEERDEKGAGARGPCPGEAVAGPGRPVDSEEVKEEKLEVPDC